MSQHPATILGAPLCSFPGGQSADPSRHGKVYSCAKSKFWPKKIQSSTSKIRNWARQLEIGSGLDIFEPLTTRQFGAGFGAFAGNRQALSGAATWKSEEFAGVETASKNEYTTRVLPTRYSPMSSGLSPSARAIMPHAIHLCWGVLRRAAML